MVETFDGILDMTCFKFSFDVIRESIFDTEGV
jgi:hypothetical protein